MPPPLAAPAAAAAAQRQQAQDALRQQVQTAYTTPGNPIAFSAPAAVARHFGISHKLAKNFLEGVESYGLHREYKQPKHYNPYYVHKRRKQVQGDLIDIARIAARNDAVKFLLLLIDVFTKKIWVYPLLNKSAASMRRALGLWLQTLGGDTPEILMTDKGREFIGAPVQQLLRARGVEWQAAIGTLKAAVAERVNKTLQILIYKYLSQNETVRYIDKLRQLVDTYNRRPHRTLDGMSPLEADRPASEPRVQAIHHERYAKIAQHRRTSLPFRVGDFVRVKTEPKKLSSSARAYAVQFHGEFYRIVRINRTLPIALYYLRSLVSGELISGGFYANELQRRRGDVYRIERVLARRTRRGVRELYVKWQGLGEQWNEWIAEGQVERAF